MPGTAVSAEKTITKAPLYDRCKVFLYNFFKAAAFHLLFGARISLVNVLHEGITNE